MTTATRITYRMRHVLRELSYRGFIVASNTNATLNALEKRGLVTTEPDAHARKTYRDRWVLTEAGKLAL